MILSNVIFFRFLNSAAKIQFFVFATYRSQFSFVFFYFCGEFEERQIMIDQIIEYNKTFVSQKGCETHPLVPKDIMVRSFIIDSETGKLEEVEG